MVARLGGTRRRRRGALCAGLFATVALAGCEGIAPAALAHPAVESEASPQVASLEDAPRSRELYLKLIADLRDSGRAHAALAHLDAYDREHPRDPRAALLRADCLADVGESAQAEAIYRRLLRGREASAAYAGLGRLAAHAENWPSAAAAFTSAAQRDPTSPTLLGDLGYALLRAGDAHEAVFRLREAAELAPGDARIRNNLILALAAAGDSAAARAMLAQIGDAQERGKVEALMASQAPAQPPTPAPGPAQAPAPSAR